MKKQEQEPRPHEVKDPLVPIVQGVEQAAPSGSRIIS